MLGILSNCNTTGKVTEVNPCVEIPFVDGAEGACTNTVTHKAFIIPHEKWEKQRPHMIMIHADDWTKIKKDWLRGCRMVMQDGGKCNVALETVDNAITKLNKLVEVLK